MRRVVAASLALHAIVLTLVARAPGLAPARVEVRSSEALDVTMDVASSEPSMTSSIEPASIEGDAIDATQDPARESARPSSSAPSLRALIHADAVPSEGAPSFADMIQAQIASMDPGGFGHVNPALLGSTAPARSGGGLSHPELFPSVRVPDVVIANVVRANAGRLRVCYALGARRDPTLHGEIDVAFEIGPSGQVSEAHDDGGALDDEAVRQCVVRTFASLSFAAPPTGKAQRMRFPVRFGKEERPEAQ